MAAPPGLTDSFTEEGYWWLEGREADQVGGTLTFDPANGPQLNLLGVLGDLIDSFNAALAGGERGYETIYGFTKRGKKVTLLRSMNTSRQLNMPGIANEVWKAHLLVIGMHLKDADQDEAFSKSYLRFESIERWLGHKHFTLRHNLNEKSITVTAERPPEAHFAHHEDFEVPSVGSVYTSNTPDTRYTLDVVSQMAVKPPTPKSLNWHFSRASRLQELAALCTSHNLPLLSLELRGPSDTAGANAARPSEVSVYARLIHPEAESRPKHEDPIISGPELIKFNPRAVQLWFDQHEIFSPTIALFFTITGQREMFTNVRFLLAIQALEVFHRRTSEDGIMPQAEFDRLRDSLIASIPNSASSTMNEKLKGVYRFLNEPSLGQSLKSIISDLTSSFDYSPPAFNKAYLRKLVDTRNYYTHFSKDLEDKKLDGGGMYWASRRIVLLLSILFLQRLGVSASDLARLLDRHNEFSKLWVTDGDPF